jgi:hypothetical protein
MQAAAADVGQGDHAEQRDQRREQGQEPVVGQLPAVMLHRSRPNFFPARLKVSFQPVLAAAKRSDVEVSESDWRDLAQGGKDRKR